MTGANVLAVALAAIGAALFGLAAVRQHGAVQTTMTPHSGARETVRAFWRLVRQPAWLLGAVQSGLAGLLHVAALALAPITLVQPIGVLAVPTTVVASALRQRRRPSRAQVLGSILSVAGIAVLTVLLISPEAQPVVLPSLRLLGTSVAVIVGVCALITVTRAAGPPVLRCIALAVAAAVLFGLNSILIRTLGHLLSTGTLHAHRSVALVAAVGLVLALPVGLWAMQTAYLSGSPHVVICCLTLFDPISAVAGGHLLLGDGLDVAGLTLAGTIACAAVAALGVLLLSLNYPEEALVAAPTDVAA